MFLLIRHRADKNDDKQKGCKKATLHRGVAFTLIRDSKKRFCSEMGGHNRLLSLSEKFRNGNFSCCRSSSSKGSSN